jgi:hypothetical protein
VTPQLTVKKSATGKGVFAGAPIAKGTLIMKMEGVRLRSPEVERAIAEKKIRPDDPFQVGEELFIVLDRLPYLFNHSCEPNAGFRSGTRLVALRDIKKGEEIRYDYSAVVCTHCQWSMRCRCGSTLCRKVVGNISSLPVAVCMRYKKEKLLPRFILSEI